MSTQTQGNYYSAEAAADLSTKKYYIVKTDSTGKIVLSSAATDKHLGVLFNEPTLGKTADVAIANGNGSGKVIAGGTITKDAYITSDANGKAVATTTVNDLVLGQAHESAVDGDIFEYRKFYHRYSNA